MEQHQGPDIPIDTETNTTSIKPHSPEPSFASDGHNVGRHEISQSSTVTENTESLSPALSEGTAGANLSNVSQSVAGNSLPLPQEKEKEKEKEKGEDRGERREKELKEPKEPPAESSTNVTDEKSKEEKEVSPHGR